MTSSDEERDFQQAIRLSMEKSTNASAETTVNAGKEVIDLDSESGSETTDGEKTTDEESGDGVVKSERKKDVDNVGKFERRGMKVREEAAQGGDGVLMSGIMGLDRKAMEEERLARKRKREGETEMESLGLGRKSSRVEVTRKRNSPEEVKERVPTALVSMVSGDILHADEGISIPGQVRQQASSTHSARPPSILPYPQGTVKKTYALNHPRSSDDIAIEEILQPSSLSLAVLSSFQWEVPWLLQKVNTATTQLVFVMQADDEDTKMLYRRETAALKNLKLCFPSMAGQVNCMHSKLMLLSYPTHLRVVVPTANLVPYDWGETGVMENSVFVIDLQRLPANSRIVSKEMTDFGKDLICFLNAMGLEKSIVNSLHHFDFSATEDLAFVHSIGGAHSGASEPWRKTGYCGLGRAVSRLGLTANNPLKIDYVTSSVGSLNLDFLSTMYMAAKGDDGMTEFGWRNNQPKKRDKDYHRLTKEIDTSRETAKEETKRGFTIYFPSEKTVKKSTGGPNNGGTICFQSKWWDNPKFPRAAMRDCRSRRKGLLMHNKIMYVQPTGGGRLDPARKGEKGEEEGGEKAWAYIGSANCSESAWGRMVKDRETKQGKLNSRNWECGVVIPLRRMAIMSGSLETKERGMGEREKAEGLKKFEGVVPVPMETPGKEYGDGRPWFYSEYY